MRNQHIILGLAMALSTIFGNVNAQAPQRCGTDQLLAKHQAQNPALAVDMHRLDQAWSAQAAASSGPRGGVRTIPVVVHIIQSNTVVKISDDRVQSQIDVLNEDFRRLNADTTNIPAIFQGVAADCGIAFCLATIDPNGCPTDGINRIVSPANANHDSNDESQLKALIQWPPRKYLNIWVPESMPGLLGYATFPGQLNFSPSLDGVVINGQNFGRGFGTPPSTYALGRTATHEIGHWLGLLHTFQGGCAGNSASSCSTQGDLICDTPPTMNENFGCPSGLNTCTETPTDQIDQTSNFMDYGDDPCLNMYSQGQATRCYFYLDNVRSQIWSAANLTLTGCDGTVSPGCAPAANFTESTTSACTGAPVQFTDLSTGPASSWQWTFSGGTPASSTTQNPVVTYAAAGLYDVFLTVTNSFGTATETRFAHITVTDPSATPLAESFESILFFPQGWSENNEDGGEGWKVNTTVSSAGQNSMMVANFIANGTGSTDALISHPFDLSGMGISTLTYDRAYKRRTAFLVDSFYVDVSTDCGSTWARARTLYGGGLATIAGLAAASPYVPLAAHWKKDTVDLTPFAGSNAVKVRFMLRSGGGQNIYLDQVNIDGLVSREASNQVFQGLGLAPNPSTQAPSLVYHRLRPGRATYSISTLQGQTIMEVNTSAQGTGQQQIPLSSVRLDALPAGIYLVRFEAEGMQQSLKWVKTN